MCNKILNYHFLQINFASGLDLPCVYHYADDTLYQQCARMCQYPDTDPTHSSVASQPPVCAFPTPCHTADWCQTPQYVHYYAPEAHNPHCARRRNCKINLPLVCCEKWIALMKILWKTPPSIPSCYFHCYHHQPHRELGENRVENCRSRSFSYRGLVSGRRDG